VTPFEIGLVSVVSIIVLIYAGIYVPVALALTSFVGVWLMRGNMDVAVNLLVLTTTRSISDYVFGVIPLFVLMGLLVSEADLGRDTYQVANQGLRRLPAGLGMATVAANMIFAAITGITIASAAVFSRISVPEMLKFGYDRRFAVGVVAGSSVLGMLIPPSVLLIVYALIAEQSIGAMFLAGIVPGILLSAAFCLGILLMSRYWPGFVYAERELAEQSPDDGRLGWLAIAAKLGPTVLLVVLVLGGIYGGVFTPTEAGAAGALAALVIALAKRRLSWRSLWKLLVEAGHITASILFIIIAATMYSRMLGISGLPTEISEAMQGVEANLALIVALFIVLAVVLGTIIDSISIILILVPLFLPLLAPFDVNLVWFGIIAVVAVEIGLLTPPFGIACYVIRSTLADQGVTLEQVFAGAAPFAAIMLLVLVLLAIFPGITLIFL